MIDVWECCRKWIVEDGRCLTKIDAVLLEILVGFFRIPSECHWSSVRFVRFVSFDCRPAFTSGRYETLAAVWCNAC